MSLKNMKSFSEMCLVLKILNGLAAPPPPHFLNFRTAESVKSTRLSSTARFHPSAFFFIKNCSSITSFKNSQNMNTDVYFLIGVRTLCLFCNLRL